MADVVNARNAYMAARRQVTETRLALGRAIQVARQDIEQNEIATKLGLTREQVRRYQAEYERVELGRQVREARERGVLLRVIAGELRLSIDRARQYQAEYEKSTATERFYDADDPDELRLFTDADMP